MDHVWASCRKVAIVTGGSKDIGAATVVELARQGAKVVINISSSATPAEELVKQIGPDNALAVKADACTIACVEAIVKQTIDKFGKIDIVIPNAGSLPIRDLESTTETDFDKTIAINVKGPYFLAQARVLCRMIGKSGISLANLHPRRESGPSHVRRWPHRLHLYETLRSFDRCT
jgi:NAD(P)-dependent dehydrogenase (short-subunit alcohol dehydrogenase family)